MKKLLCLLLTLLLLPLSSLAAGGYTDVPADSWAVSAVETAASYRLMEGMGNGTFGYGRTISRGEFVTVLARMMDWDTSDSSVTYSDVKGHWSAPYVAASVKNGVNDGMGSYRPDAPITRQEMAVMLVRALGYGTLAGQISTASLPFTDVTTDRGYITVAYDIGMTNGISDTQFAPNASATREQAAAMLVRIYEKTISKTDWLHAFYAISSYSQIGLTGQMDAVSLGWSRMTYSRETGAVLNTTSAGGNVYAIPSGYEDALQTLKDNGCALSLSVFMDNSGGTLTALLADPNARAQAVSAILMEATRPYEKVGYAPYAGVTIDFEGLAGEVNRDNFTAFLTALSQGCRDKELTLTVAVMPVTADGAYFNGYDYRAIGALADKVILMAHDYQPSTLAGFLGTTYYKNAALTPLSSVYTSLKAAADPETGVQDKAKLALAISFAANAWQTDANGKLISEKATSPAMKTVASRLQNGAVMGWSDTYRNPYLTYTTESGQHIFLWYEDARSVAEKVSLAKLFGITSVSLWRLGNIPALSQPGLYFDALPACS